MRGEEVNNQSSAQHPEPDWDEMRTVPRCAFENCRHFDGKRCALMGFEPGSLCEPAVQQMGEVIGVLLANREYTEAQREEYLLGALHLTREEFERIGEGIWSHPVNDDQPVERAKKEIRLCSDCRVPLEPFTAADVKWCPTCKKTVFD